MKDYSFTVCIQITATSSLYRWSLGPKDTFIKGTKPRTHSYPKHLFLSHYSCFIATAPSHKKKLGHHHLSLLPVRICHPSMGQWVAYAAQIKKFTVYDDLMGVMLFRY